MRSRRKGNSQTWVIVAIPAGLVVFLLIVSLVLFGLRPEKKPEQAAAGSSAAKPPAPRSVERTAPEPRAPASPAPEPAAPVPAAPQPAAPQPAAPVPSPAVAPPSEPPPPKQVPAAPATRPAAPASTAGRPATGPAAQQATPPPPPAAAPAPVDLLASFDPAASAVSGTWQKDGATLRCTDASAQNRAKLRLAPPPPGPGYDIAVTFTAQGDRRFVAQVLSFRGKQFIFAMFSSQSGFASVRGQNALANDTTRNKGITAGKKHTSLVKVRETEVSAYLDGELLSTHATDYSDLALSDAWNLGPGSTRQDLLGLAVECPIVVEAITLTPVQAQPAAQGSPSAASSYADLARLISSPWSTESSAAATQPAAASPRIKPADLESLVAASQPVISDVAADLLRKPGPAAPSATQPAGSLQDKSRDDLFRAVQITISPAAQLPDPLMESTTRDGWPDRVDRAEFELEQARITAWRTLAGRMSEFYPNAQTRSELVKLQVTPTGAAAKGRPDSFFATHTHSEPLTNVTLAVEIVHAMTNPAATAVHHYFIPTWSPGQKVFFPAGYVPNVASQELLEHPAPSPLHPLNGIIEARVQAWSDKLSQPGHVTNFDPKFQVIARSQLNEAYRVVEEAVRGRPATTLPAPGAARPPARPIRRSNALIPGPVIPARANLEEGSEALALARASAQRALRLLPPQSSLADDARELIAEPPAALRSLRERQLKEFIAALALRSPRAGVFVPQQPGMLARLARPAERDTALNEAGAAGGRVTMIVDSRMTDGSGVSVTLSSAAEPELRRKFTGRLQVDLSGNRLLLNLRPAQPPPANPPERVDPKRIAQWSSLLLELRNNNTLCGVATAGPAAALNVAFGQPAASPDAPKPAAPRKPRRRAQ